MTNNGFGIFTTILEILNNILNGTSSKNLSPHNLQGETNVPV